MKLPIAISVVAAAIATAYSVEAQSTEIDISAQANSNIQTFTDGGNYQLGGTQLNAAGVPFGLAELNGNANTTGAILTSGGNFDFTFAVPAGTEATSLYSLANLGFGAAGAPEGQIVVTGTHGETATLNLVGGVNVRDHNNDGFINTLSDPTVVPTYFLNGAPTTADISIQTRLDRQELDLGPAFNGDTISTIQLEGNSIPGGGDGTVFLAGLTLVDAPVSSAVPEGNLPLPLTAGVFAAMLALGQIRRTQARRSA